MKNIKRVFVLSAYLFLWFLVSANVNAQITGKCGENSTYIDDGKGTLTIKGQGYVNNIPTVANVDKGSSASIKNLIVEEGITSIDCDLSWIYVGTIENVSLPQSIKDINRTFSNTEIKSIILPSGVKEIKEKAFYGCGKLKKITLSEETTTIGKDAFLDCVSLKEIIIPKNVVSIGQNAFQHMDNLMRFENNSNIECQLPTKRCGAYKLRQTFYIGKKKVTTVPAHKIAIGKWNSYKVTLKTSGGKLIGKNVTKHTYNTSEKLPKAKKKGYKFFGWKLKNSSLGVTHEKINKAICQNVTYKAIFKKVEKKKKGKKTTITLNNPKILDIASNLYIKIPKQKKIKKDIIFKINLSKKTTIKKNGVLCKYIPKKNKVTIKFLKNKLEKIKIYWGDDGDTESETISKEYSILK